MGVEYAAMIKLEQFLTGKLENLAQGDPDYRRIEKYLASVRKDIAKDKKSSSETIATPKREAFAPQEREALTKEGLVIVRLTGQSIADQKSQGRPFWYITDGGKRFLNVPSRTTEVAFNPNPSEFFIPRSNNSTLKQQLEMTQEHSYKLQRRLGIKTIEEIMGEAPDYTETAFSYLETSGERLFGVNYGYNYTRTQTPTVDSRVAGVGDFYAVDGLRVHGWYRGYGFSYVFAAPLVVPKS